MENKQLNYNPKYYQNLRMSKISLQNQTITKFYYRPHGLYNNYPTKPKGTFESKRLKNNI